MSTVTVSRAKPRASSRPGIARCETCGATISTNRHPGVVDRCPRSCGTALIDWRPSLRNAYQQLETAARAGVDVEATILAEGARGFVGTFSTAYPVATHRPSELDIAYAWELMQRWGEVPAADAPRAWKANAGDLF